MALLGAHRAPVFASDGNTVRATRLEVGPYVEGNDPDWNYPPELQDASVEPWDGSPAEEFVFFKFSILMKRVTSLSMSTLY